MTTNEEDLSGLCPDCAEPLDSIGRCPRGCDEIDEDEDCLAMGHDDKIVFEDDDVIQWRCNRCGAEGIDDKVEGP